MNETEKVKNDLHKLVLEGEDDERKQFLPPTYSLGEEWVVDYMDQFGTEPSFF